MGIYTGITAEAGPESGGHIVTYDYPIEKVIVGDDFKNIRITIGTKYVKKVESHYMLLEDVTTYLDAQFPGGGSYTLDNSPSVERWASGVDLFKVTASGSYVT